ncbi:MarR family transcriptional regulator [Nocardiopsis sp. EMB25]|uniref:helix-turn-helix domain-containing protein n=1 Tax=Nocardiopsis sp. EMB25 TaxID=2835867 RepID=UPI002283AAD2|nr:MarR family transcriptional regulator [Nocardiopsis sp. EMB25]MCY9787097.1 MarR family transcriptional regulator [Nocardiopsis sp. EMB25]
MTTTASAPRRSATRTRDLILATLAQAPEPVTVTALAEEAGIARSTLGKYLPGLEKEGLAVRTPGGRDGQRRLPDTWQAATSTDADTTDSEDTSPAQDHEGDSVDAVPAEPEAVADTASAPVTPAPEVRAQDFVSTAHAEEGPVEEVATTTSRTPDAPTQPAPAPATPPQPRTASPRTHVTTAAEDVNPVSGSTRLAPGELKLMVRAILDSDPGEEFTATMISHLLQGRSIGAIQNNLARLAKEGHAVQTGDRPRRYRSAKAAN